MVSLMLAGGIGETICLLVSWRLLEEGGRIDRVEVVLAIEHELARRAPGADWRRCAGGQVEVPPNSLGHGGIFDRSDEAHGTGGQWTCGQTRTSKPHVRRSKTAHARRRARSGSTESRGPAKLRAVVGSALPPPREVRGDVDGRAEGAGCAGGAAKGAG